MSRRDRFVAAWLLGGLACVAASVTDRAAAAASPPGETMIVHGQKRFLPAPVPNQRIHDPADVLRDPSTGAPLGRFGGSYIDANPVPAVNPELKGDQSPVQVGVQR